MGDGEDDFKSWSAPEDFKRCEVCKQRRRFVAEYQGKEICDSCVDFFETSVKSRVPYICINERECSIRPRKVFRCSFCHLIMCFDLGMKAEKVGETSNSECFLLRQTDSICEAQWPDPIYSTQEEDLNEKILSEIQVVYDSILAAEIVASYQIINNPEVRILDPVSQSEIVQRCKKRGAVAELIVRSLHCHDLIRLNKSFFDPYNCLQEQIKLFTMGILKLIRKTWENNLEVDDDEFRDSLTFMEEAVNVNQTMVGDYSDRMEEILVYLVMCETEAFPFLVSCRSETTEVSACSSSLPEVGKLFLDYTSESEAKHSNTEKPTAKACVMKKCEVCEEYWTLTEYRKRAICDQCQIFFEKSITNREAYVCERKGRCPVNPRFRYKCDFCYLSKCFDLGMKAEDFGKNLESMCFLLAAKDSISHRQEAKIQTETLADIRNVYSSLITAESAVAHRINENPVMQQLGFNATEEIANRCRARGAVVELVARSLHCHDLIRLDTSFFDPYCCTEYHLKLFTMEMLNLIRNTWKDNLEIPDDVFRDSLTFMNEDCDVDQRVVRCYGDQIEKLVYCLTLCEQKTFTLLYRDISINLSRRGCLTAEQSHPEPPPVSKDAERPSSSEMENLTPTDETKNEQEQRFTPEQATSDLKEQPDELSQQSVRPKTKRKKSKKNERRKSPSKSRESRSTEFENISSASCESTQLPNYEKGYTSICPVCDYDGPDLWPDENPGTEVCRICYRYFIDSVKTAEDPQCERDGHCRIATLAVNRCRFCWLNKCYEVGMDPDAVYGIKVPQGKEYSKLSRAESEELNKRASYLSEYFIELEQHAYSWMKSQKTYQEAGADDQKTFMESRLRQSVIMELLERTWQVRNVLRLGKAFFNPRTCHIKPIKDFAMTVIEIAEDLRDLGTSTGRFESFKHVVIFGKENDYRNCPLATRFNDPLMTAVLLLNLCEEEKYISFLMTDDIAAIRKTAPPP